MSRESEPRLPAPAALETGGELPAFTPVPRQRMRRGGWSAERQRAFIQALAETGSVRAACRRLGVGEHHIYKLRRHPEGESFRKAWEAALDLGIKRIEDIAMDRAINGVEVPVYHAGEMVGTRRVYNDRLLMFLLKNRAPERFGEWQSARSQGAIGQTEKRRLKKKWRKQFRAEWEAERSGVSPAEVRKSIEAKVERVRAAVEAERAAEWESLSEETRAAWETFAQLRQRDLEAQERGPTLPEPVNPDDLPALAEAGVEGRAPLPEPVRPEPVEGRAPKAQHKHSPHRPYWEMLEAEPEPWDGIRRLKDDGWE